MGPVSRLFHPWDGCGRETGEKQALSLTPADAMEFATSMGSLSRGQEEAEGLMEQRSLRPAGSQE